MKLARQHLATRLRPGCSGGSVGRQVARLGVVALAIAAAFAFELPAAARAASVLVLDRDGRTVVRNEPLPPETHPTRLMAAAAGDRGRKARVLDRNVRTELARLYRHQLISAAVYRSDLGAFNAALATVHRLQGTRAAELEAVVENLHSIAARRMLTPSRLPALFLTLERNQQWWSSGPLLSTYQRVEFAGSRLVWEYYPGQGLELQILGSFSVANALCTAGPAEAGACTELLSELIPLAANRGGHLIWEYYFQFDGGLPPWTSAMSQGTALQALAHAYRETGDVTYLEVGERALAAFTAAPPAGVAVRTPLGSRYVQYTFDPARGDEVINAFLQSLIGLEQFAQASNNPLAAQLFAAGNAEAQAELPLFDTGAWSLYRPGVEDDLSYHELVTGFLQQLCSMTSASVYCLTASHFEQDLKTSPAIQLITRRLVARQPSAIYFELSKVSRVGILVMRGTTPVFLTSAQFPYGEQALAVPPLRSGTYTVRLAATDLAGNFSRAEWSVRVVRPVRHRGPLSAGSRR